MNSEEKKEMEQGTGAEMVPEATEVNEPKTETAVEAVPVDSPQATGLDDEAFVKLKTELMDEIRKYFEPLLKNEVVASFPVSSNESEESDDEDEPVPEQEEESLIAKLLQETRR
ncbi:MAG: hypothetical protein LCH52_10310 [Bacteroidetes bacterium]|nr:hypothetical protein [Bacteroidota bacterium]